MDMTDLHINFIFLVTVYCSQFVKGSSLSLICCVFLIMPGACFKLGFFKNQEEKIAESAKSPLTLAIRVVIAG